MCKTSHSKRCRLSRESQEIVWPCKYTADLPNLNFCIITRNLFFYSQKLIVFSSPFTTTHRASFYISTSCTHCQMSNGSIFGLSRAMRYDGLPTNLFSSTYDTQSFAQSAYLI